MHLFSAIGAAFLLQNIQLTFGNDDCGYIIIGDTPFVVDYCIGSGDISIEYECIDADTVYYNYYDSGDCSANLSWSFDYSSAAEFNCDYGETNDCVSGYTTYIGNYSASGIGFCDIDTVVSADDFDPDNYYLAAAAFASGVCANGTMWCCDDENVYQLSYNTADCSDTPRYNENETFTESCVYYFGQLAGLDVVCGNDSSCPSTTTDGTGTGTGTGDGTGNGDGSGTDSAGVRNSLSLWFAMLTMGVFVAYC